MLHRVDLVNQRTAQAIRGVNDTTSITGVYPWRSMTVNCMPLVTLSADPTEIVA